MGIVINLNNIINVSALFKRMLCLLHHLNHLDRFKLAQPLNGETKCPWPSYLYGSKVYFLTSSIRVIHLGTYSVLVFGTQHDNKSNEQHEIDIPDLNPLYYHF